MQIEFSPHVDKKLATLARQDSRAAAKIKSQLKLFAANPQHPSLRLHKLNGPIRNLWSISITMSIRMVFVLDGDTAYFTDIGTHDQVYRK